MQPNVKEKNTEQRGEWIPKLVRFRPKVIQALEDAAHEDRMNPTDFIRGAVDVYLKMPSVSRIRALRKAARETANA